jgi:L-alanine-DL-glutamate epimerase-like enolase superfamily enzyme
MRDRSRRGYPAIKLHETTVPPVSAARQAIGADIPLMVDLNCPMDGNAAIAFAHACRAAAPLFLEEPVWPPEDFKTLAEVRVKGGLDVAAGENACTVHQFRQMMAAGAVTYAQPSVIKVGGITEYLKVAALADEMGVALAPHSPYFGPGFFGNTASHVASRRRHVRRGVLHEPRRMCLAGTDRYRREGGHRSTRWVWTGLRARHGDHGALPRAVIRSEAVSTSPASRRVTPTEANRLRTKCSLRCARPRPAGRNCGR